MSSRFLGTMILLLLGATMATEMLKPHPKALKTFIHPERWTGRKW